MKTLQIGRSSLRVSRLALGTMNFGYDWHGVGALTEREARNIFDRAADAGVNFIDTADIYGYGAAEKLLKKILKGRRDKFLIASKVLGMMTPGDPSTGGLSRKHITAGLNATLKRLGTDYVDLYMPHAPDRNVPWPESLEAFDRAVSAGKVRVLGCSNFMRNDWELCLRWAEDLNRPRFEFNESQFSLAWPFMMQEVGDFCVKKKLSVLAWSPLGGGLLSGKYMGKRRSKGRRQNDSDKVFPYLDESRLGGVLEVLQKISKHQGLTMAQVALGWILAKPWVASTILGVRTPDQLEELLASKPLDKDSVVLLDRLAAAYLQANPAVG
jgi:aryl-alcohol dehydrogenase-like predicted oxidoreductase